MDNYNKITATEKGVRSPDRNVGATEHILTLDGRSKLSISGIEKVVSSSDTIISLLTNVGGLTIAGKNMRIVRYNVSDGSFAAEGEIDSIKYNAAKTPFIRRMFK